MMYDQHSASGDPGPIASQEWVEKIADKRFAEMNSRKVVLGLENRYYDWPIEWNKDGSYTAAKAATVGNVVSGLALARNSHAKIEMDHNDLNPFFTYTNLKDQQDHLVYMLDAITAYNQVIALRDYEPAGAALWFLGSEDPSIWSFFAKGKLGMVLKPDNPDITTVRCMNVVPWGDGDISEIKGAPKNGKRSLIQDKNGLFDLEEYTKYPEPSVKYKFGSEHLRDVVLTFDDGPSKWTDSILDILHKNGVPAAFFVIGKNAERWQGILKRENDMGFEIGNHTYYHPELANVSVLRAQMEVNATQRIIEAITGHSTRLFRPPMGQGTDEESTDLNNLQIANVNAIMSKISSLGYLTVGFSIDPMDYGKNGHPPSAANIVQSVLKNLPDLSNQPVNMSVDKLPPALRPAGHIILLHDGGGDRSQTVKALQIIIDGVRKHGYRFVSISDLCQGKFSGSLFPPVTEDRKALAGLDRVVFETQYDIPTLLRILFFTAIVLGMMRVVVVTAFAIIQSRRARKLQNDDFTPSVTMIVPAYNEDKVICRNVEAILASDYPDLRVIAVDDGSTDDTELMLRKRFANDERVTIIRKENGGKASALNLALENCETEIAVCVDADTVIAPDAVRKLARHFADLKVGAVAGNIKIGNRTNPLAIWQSLEYISSQNFDRRAYSLFGSIPVVPGALGAWRVQAINEAGGYCPSTLAEDTDLTFRIRLLGYRTITENEALAYTEAPDNVRALYKQRFRWSFGILQALWKHRDMLCRARAGVMGFFVMPSMWIYNIFFQAIAPVIDIAAILSVLQGQAKMVMTYWAALFVLDFLATLIAFDLDHENPKAMVWLFWQRFFYRQFMYYVIWKSLLAAIQGQSIGWGKLQRKASVTAMR